MISYCFGFRPPALAPNNLAQNNLVTATITLLLAFGFVRNAYQ